MASVIFNRVKDGWYNGDLTEIIMSKNQFAVIRNGGYKKVEVTESTILACEIAFKQDTAQAALYFDSIGGKSWATRNKKLVFKDKAGNWFYK